jgi:hypothetical protein
VKRSTMFIALTMALLLVGSVWAATPKKSSNAATGMKMSGRIISSSNSELVLSSPAKGKGQQESFVINPETKTNGNLTAGSRATVRYKDENGQKVATMITAHAAHKTVSTKTTK